MIDCRVWSQGAVSCFGSAGEAHVPRRRAEVAHLHVCAYGRPEEARVLDAEYWAHLELPTAASARVELFILDLESGQHADASCVEYIKVEEFELFELQVGKALLAFCVAPLVLAVVFAAHDFGATRELKRRVERNPTLSRLALRTSRKPRATTSHDLSHDED